jgi:UDPglucose 6-dehydrogenase
MSDVAVIGAGYVGLTVAACLASLDHHVVCADVDADRIALLSKAEVPFLEHGLEELVDENLRAGRLRFVTNDSDAAAVAQFVFLCVPTPQGADGGADLSCVEQVARDIAPVLAPRAVVVNKSTMPVGSTAHVARVLHDAGARSDVAVASNPEFLREGHAVEDFLSPDRIVIGCEESVTGVRLSELYQGIRAPIMVTDSSSAEMIKYASNAFLATKISFVNAIANLCEAVDADVSEVTLGMGYDHRIGFEFLQAGPGYGGSCFPKDTAALLHTARRVGYDFSLLQGAVDVNRAQHQRIVDKVRAAVGGALDGRRVAMLGVTFKAATDDVRDSPALFVARELLYQGAVLHAYDPSVADRRPRVPAGVRLDDDPYQAARGASVLALLTEWDEFRWLDYARVREAMTEPHAIVDARNLLNPARLRRLGFSYEGVGH